MLHRVLYLVFGDQSGFQEEAPIEARCGEQEYTGSRWRNKQKVHW